MYEEASYLEIASAVHKVSSRYGVINRRKTHSFNIRLTGIMRYEFGDESITVNPGEMIYLPKGSVYTYGVESVEDSECVIINMHVDFDEQQPRVYPLNDIYCADFIMNHFSDSWNFGSTGDRYKCIARLYDLLSYMSNYDKLKYPEKSKFKVIEPAVNYLKKHIYDTSLKTDELHRLCGVSGTYFREIFIHRFGNSPKNYIIEKRLARAKAIIDSGEFESVRKLAESVGYEDSLYFSKAFKKHYGLAPTMMNDMN